LPIHATVRFSNGEETDYRDNEGNIVSEQGTARFHPEEAANAVQSEADAAVWREAGGTWVGGNLRAFAANSVTCADWA
jgi:hypothetical protein